MSRPNVETGTAKEEAEVGLGTTSGQANFVPVPESSGAIR